ncbi:hypothetical protein B0I37DRAFT_140873 [Chaetomium sp. MPI-CAGE-AT-0009]|nr:hypothetical protein B0I37DRAFT_140873 [Chaetomium sp. MPI-CAGE-AT-0009]
MALCRRAPSLPSARASLGSHLGRAPVSTKWDSRSILLKFARNTESLPLLGVLSFTACESCSLPIPSPPHHQTQDATSPPWKGSTFATLAQGRSLSASSLCPLFEVVYQSCSLLGPRFCASFPRSLAPAQWSELILFLPLLRNDSRWKRPGIVDRYDLHKSAPVSGCLIASLLTLTKPTPEPDLPVFPPLFSLVGAAHLFQVLGC